MTDISLFQVVTANLVTHGTAVLLGGFLTLLILSIVDLRSKK